MLAIDDAELLYDVEGSGSQQFWAALRLLHLDPGRCNVRVVIAAAYGADVGYLGGDSLTKTSMAIDIMHMAKQCSLDTAGTIGIHPGALSLQLDPEDVQELWDAWQLSSNLQLGDLVKDWIVTICASQVSIISVFVCAHYAFVQLSAGGLCIPSSLHSSSGTHHILCPCR